MFSTQAKTASNRLQEARGFSSTVPTTQLIKGGKAAAKQPSNSPGSRVKP
jgi:hypothetical protein